MERQEMIDKIKNDLISYRLIMNQETDIKISKENMVRRIS